MLRLRLRLRLTCTAVCDIVFRFISKCFKLRITTTGGGIHTSRLLLRSSDSRQSRYPNSSFKEVKLLLSSLRVCSFFSRDMLDIYVYVFMCLCVYAFMCLEEVYVSMMVICYASDIIEHVEEHESCLMHHSA